MNPAIFGLFFVSGACALIYQVVWTRMLTHVFGVTVLAVSTVLAAFMTGLALGSYYLGRRGNAVRNPLKRYAIYEFGIGGAALVVLFLLDRMTPFYLWMSEVFGGSTLVFGAVRFGTIFLLILVPTTLMGATLPILSQVVLRQYETIGRKLGSLYAVNTLGAVSGCLLAGFFLIGSIGLHNSIFLAAALNIVVGVVSLFMARDVGGDDWRKADAQAGVGVEDGAGEAVTALQERQRRLLLGSFAVSGVASFAYEVLWTRALVFVLGNSTYAFSIMLTTFLVGIALGGYLVRFFIDRLREPLRFFAWTQLAIGVSAALAMPLLGFVMALPLVQEWFGSVNARWGMVLVMKFGVAFAMMLLPTVLIGMTFPLAGKIFVTDLRQAGADVGKVYAVNTVGNIVGALLPAFLLIPLLGIHRGILAMGAVNVATALVILVYGRERGLVARYLAPVGLAGLGWAALALPEGSQFPSNSQEPGDEVVFYKEGIAATTKVYVKRVTGYKHISVDGIQIGGSNPELDYKQQWLAHLPKLLLRDYRTELSVGLGSGILIGESARHEALEKVLCVEIAPSVVEGARYFEAENYGILDSPRAEIVVNDGINYLLTSSDRYDIISTDGKTQPEYGVNGAFFSREYYALMRDHLKPGGLVIQWIPIHYPPDVFKTVLRTFSGVFPHACLWYSESNCFLVGSHHELEFDPEAIDRKLGDDEQPFEGLRKFGVTSSEAVLAQLVASEDVLREQTRGMQENSLEKPVVEFYDFGDYAVSEVERKRRNLDFIRSIRGTGKLGARIEGFPGAVRKAFEAEGAYLAGQAIILEGGNRKRLEKHFERALALAPENQNLRHHIYGHYLETGRDLMQAEKFAAAEPYLERANAIWPNDADARYRYGFLLLKTGRGEEALREFEATIALDPGRASLRHRLASVYLRNGRSEEAIVHLRAILAGEPGDTKALLTLGNLLAGKELFTEALPLLERAHRSAPEDPAVIDSYAWVAFLAGERERARRIVRSGGNYYSGSGEMRKRREAILK